MHTDHPHQTLSLQDGEALFAAARQGARQARSEAIDAFWSGLGHGLATAWRVLRRGGPGLASQATPRA